MRISLSNNDEYISGTYHVLKVVAGPPWWSRVKTLPSSVG